MPQSVVLVTNNKWEQTTQIFDLDCQIFVDDEANPASESESLISGRVVLTVCKPTTFYGMSLILVGKATSNVPTPNSNPRKAVPILLSPTWCDPQLADIYHTADIIKSHLKLVKGGTCELGHRVYLSADIPSTLTNRTKQSSIMMLQYSAMDSSIVSNALRTQLHVGIHTFPFSIELDNFSNIPPTLKNSLGCIQHLLCLYMNPIPIPIPESKKTKPAGATDYLMLSKFYEKEIILRPRINCNLSEFSVLQVTSKREGSVTGAGGVAKSCIQGDLLLDQSKLVLGEIIKFKLTITNQNGGRISETSLSLVQKIKYYTCGFSKSQISTISSAKYPGIVGTKPNLEWEGSLDTSKVVLYSYSTKLECIDIFHFVQFTILVIGKGEVTGEIPVTIGSTRTSVPSDEILNQNKGDITILDHQYCGPDLTTGDSLEVLPISFPSTSSSWRSSLSHRRVSLPPAYSELSLVGLCRASSLETLPPPYDEVADLKLAMELSRKLKID